MVREPGPTYRGPYRGPHVEAQHGWHFTVTDARHREIEELPSTQLDETDAAKTWTSLKYGSNVEVVKNFDGTFQPVKRDGDGVWEAAGKPFRLQRGERVTEAEAKQMTKPLSTYRQREKGRYV